MVDLCVDDDGVLRGRDAESSVGPGEDGELGRNELSGEGERDDENGVGSIDNPRGQAGVGCCDRIGAAACAGLLGGREAAQQGSQLQQEQAEVHGDE